MLMDCMCFGIILVIIAPRIADRIVVSPITIII